MFIEIDVQYALQFATCLCVTRHDQPRAVGRPVEVADVPGSIGALLHVPARGRNGEEVVIAPVHVAAAVVLVVEAADDAGHRRAAQLLAGFGGSRVVDDGAGVGQHGAQERDALAVGRPPGHADSVRDEAQLLRWAPGRDIEHEELVGSAHLADERDAAAVGRPLGGMVPEDARGRLDRFGVEKAADDDTGPILSRRRVRPADLVGDALAVGAEADVIDPAETVKIFGRERGGHADWWMLPATADSIHRSRSFRWYNHSR